ncbi:proline dehydrogenase family protein [Candidatus Kapabacteria bacterium]|nr:proline dehydrogenase family protein [Candidatus Kapabacteria bacterium]
MLNELIIKLLPVVPKPIIRYFANNYIAGETIDEAFEKTQKVLDKGAHITLDVLGEYVTSKDQTLKDMRIRLDVIDRIASTEKNITQSIKLTSLGLGLDDLFAYDNTKQIVKHANENNVFIQFDMEDSPFHDKTIQFYKDLREEGFENIGLVFQSYMRRAENDILSLIDYKPTLRLTKGIYIEPENIAFKTHEEINLNYQNLLHIMLDNDMKVGMATHDEELIQYCISQIEQRNLTEDNYEFQMLLGVREDKRDELISAGHPLRVYISFGKDWYGYSIRRFKENPKVAGHVFKAIFS